MVVYCQACHAMPCRPLDELAGAVEYTVLPLRPSSLRWATHSTPPRPRTDAARSAGRAAQRCPCSYNPEKLEAELYPQLNVDGSQIGNVSRNTPPRPACLRRPVPCAGTAPACRGVRRSSRRGCDLLLEPAPLRHVSCRMPRALAQRRCAPYCMRRRVAVAPKHADACCPHVDVVLPAASYAAFPQ